MTPHSLKSSEVYCIISGAGEMRIDDESRRVETGDAVCIPPPARQFIRKCGAEPAVFVCIVEPAWRKEDETVYQEEISI